VLLVNRFVTEPLPVAWPLVPIKCSLPIST
jgi:hypothetical protein